MIRVYIAVIALFLSINVHAQGYVDQQAVRPFTDAQHGDITGVTKVIWTSYLYTGNADSLYHHLDSIPGYYKGSRRYIIELANRITFDQLRKGRELFVPEYFEEDYRAYSPYPFEYDSAISLPKLFIIDKFTQTFGAYEYGKLARWGLVSSGRKNDLTPQGRYNFNWKTYYRKSTAAPPGEVWEMYWVFDFHSKFGIHVHQYSLPIAIAASHGCVRTAEGDAIWNFEWANGWVHDAKGRLVRNGTPVMVINHNPKGRPAHWKMVNNKTESQIHLPVSFDEVRLGTAEQRIAPWQSGW